MENQKSEEQIRQITGMELPLTWENAFVNDDRTKGVTAATTADGLVLSLSNLGRVDIEYISSITGIDPKHVILSLKGAILQNPKTWDECFYKGWETKEEYLTGNIYEKLKEAKAANAVFKGYFEENVRALEEAMPKQLSSEEIYVTLGSPWIPADVIDDFIEYLFGKSAVDAYNERTGRYELRDVRQFARTHHDETTGSWEIPYKSRYHHNLDMTKRYGTKRMEALHILEKTLNMRSVAVTDEVRSRVNASGKSRVINEIETVAAIEKQKLQIQKFQEWVWRDPDRKARLTEIYMQKYSCFRRRHFDGSYLTFPTMSKSVELYPYQKNAVARILSTPNTLLAHDVGAGKTYVMIAAGMEFRRIGLSKKNLYVVPNNIVGQWKSIFLSMYPGANLLVVDPNAFTSDRRSRTLKAIRDNDYDGIIMAYSCFERIPVSKKVCEEELQKEIDSLKEALKDPARRTGVVERRLDRLRKLLNDLIVAGTKGEDGPYFDELGVSRLFLDEAHNYKNVPIETKIENVMGVNKTGSKKCRDMLLKVHIVQQQNFGGGVVFATGTPITNSVTDVYTMQRYLQSGELSLLDLESFDSWVGMFAEQHEEFEIDVDTSTYRLATRLSRFHNLPELTTMLASFADFHSVDQSDGLPEFSGYTDGIVRKSPEFAEFLEDISERAEDVRNGRVSRKKDNMLLITTDGRKAALDMRLIDAKVPVMDSKALQAAENVADIYWKTMDRRSTQLVFCDTSTPKDTFNLYDEMKRLLIRFGIPESEIAFIHSAGTEAKRKRLFKAVRDGDVRVLIGSTFKLGLGVNVQDRLIAVHHLDVPWRPADMTQREGRILRQGNENQKVCIFRYITEGSFDAYSWQLLETKQRFISDLLSGSISERSAEDIENTVLSYAEVKALAIGNPLMKERVETANELSRSLALQRKLTETCVALRQALADLPGEMQKMDRWIDCCRKDEAEFKAWEQAHPFPESNQEKEALQEERRNLRKILGDAVRDNVLATSEKVLMDYKGFRIILPAAMDPAKPYVWLEGNGRYRVELGGTDIGILIRIDNVMTDFPDRLSRLERRRLELSEREKEIRKELAKNDGYQEKIEELKRKLAALDEKLGVG